MTAEDGREFMGLVARTVDASGIHYTLEMGDGKYIPLTSGGIYNRARMLPVNGSKEHMRLSRLPTHRRNIKGGLLTR